MKKVALIAIVLLAGCASTDTQTPVTDPKIASLEQERRAIAEREQQCIDNTLIHSRDEMAHLAATAASGDSPMQRAKNERDRELSECRAKADSDNAQISERERSEYALEAQRERDRASLMMILTTTRPR
ncbi:MAG TPA: hypothetical protein VN825_07900 [Candidatus Acidoferrum sp.]|jgi:hypothetical protein|nr:hypothetical protein [Candidatus Acidoferrum sp.]